MNNVFKFENLHKGRSTVLIYAIPKGNFKQIFILLNKNKFKTTNLNFIVKNIY